MHRLVHILITALAVLLCASHASAQTYLVGFKSVSKSYKARVTNNARVVPGVDVYIVDERTAAQLKRNPYVEFIEPDDTLYPAREPNDPHYLDPNAFFLQQIQAPAGWDIATGAVLIAVIDTGVSPHEDLSLVTGYNVVTPSLGTEDGAYHGTSVAGVAGAITNNSIGVAGVCWQCSIQPIRVTNESGAAVSAIVAGVSWVTKNSTARVANISYAVGSYKTFQRAAKAYARAGGVLVVVAGNQGGTAFSGSRDFLTVGAVDSSDTITGYSGLGADLVAPGHVATTSAAGSYAAGDGTSFAAPQVAGAVAILLTFNPALSSAQVMTMVKASCDDIGAVGHDSVYGNGRLNVARLLTQ